MDNNVNDLLKKGASTVLSCYIIMMGLIYPLYIRESGYASIGHDKYIFFRTATLIMLTSVFLLAMMIFVSGEKKIKWLPNLTQLATIIFLMISSISWVFSAYRTTAWHGSEGWFIGLETYIMLIAAYFLISSLWTYNKWVWVSFLVGSGIAFFIAILNRFSIYPFKFDLMAPEFISTLGNINWIAGYFSVVYPIGAGLFIFSEKNYLRYLSGFFAFIALCMGIVQGSESVFLSITAVFYLLLLLSLNSWEKYGTLYILLAIIFCAACQAMRLLRLILPNGFNYGSDDFSGAITESSLSLFMMLILIAFYLLIKYCRGNKAVKLINLFLTNEIFKKLVIFLPIVLAILFIIAIVINTANLGGFTRFTESSVFIWGDDWGSSRGATWNIAITAFRNMNFMQKLIGIGTDSFSDFIYSFPALTEFLNGYFNNRILRNAHNEILTMMVNTGILGTIAFFAIFITFVTRFLKNGSTNPLLFIPALCVSSYLVHNLFSFSQVLNLPLIFIIMAIGENMTRNS